MRIFIMPIIKNEKVVDAWLNGEVAQGSHLRTDGSDLFSYNLRVGYTTGTVRKHKTILKYTRGGNSHISKSTSQHVNIAIRKGVKAKNPA